MADDISQSRYRGLGIPSTVWQLDNIWSAESSYTEQTPRPPEVSADQQGGFAFSAAGVVSESNDYDLRISRSGYQGPNGPGMLWRYDGEADALFRGWDPPSWVTGYTPLWIDTSPSSGLQSTSNPHSASLPSGEVLVAYQGERDIVGTTYYTIDVDSLSPDGTTSTVTVESTETALSQDTHPCLLVMPSGDVLLVAWGYDSSSQTGYLRVWRRPDGSSSWQVHQRYAGLSVDCSGTPGSGSSGYDLSRLRGAVSRLGSIVLCVEVVAHDTDTGRNQLWQCVSNDGGATFSTVYQTTPASGLYEGRSDVVAVGEQFVIARYGANVNDIAFARLAAPGQPIDEADDTTLSLSWDMVSVTSNALTDGEITMTVDEDGAIYFLTKATTTSGGAYDNAVTMYRSPDTGLTWQPIGTGDTAVFGTAPVDVFTTGPLSSTANYPRDIAITANAGRVMAACNWANTGASVPNSLIIAHLGGWSSAELPAAGPSIRSDYRAKMTYGWLPLSAPDNAGMTSNSSGTSSVAIESEGFNITCSTGTRYYNATPGANTAGIVAELDVETDTGFSVASLAGDHCVLRIQHTVSSLIYVAKIRIAEYSGAIHAELWDENAGAAVGSQLSLAGFTKIQIRLFVRGPYAVAFARGLDEFGSDRDWQEVAETSSLTSAAGSAHDVSFGTRSTAAVAYWCRRFVYGVGDSDLGAGIRDQSRPDDYAGRPVSSSHQWIADGVLVAADRGPGRYGDTYTLTGAAEYPVRLSLPGESKSLRVEWRGASATTPAAESIAFAASTTLLGTAESRPLSDAVALLLLGCNARTGTLKGYDVGTAAWVDIGDIDMASGMTGLAWARSGNTVRPTLSGSTVWVEANELEGATFKLGTSYRRIGKHRGGCLDPSGTGGPALVLPLDGVTALDGTSGIANGEIWSTRGVLVAHLLGQTYAGYQVVWDSQKTVDGYIKAGVQQLYDLELLRGPSYGWSRRTTDNVEESRASDGTIFTRELGPVGEQLRIAFTDPTWTASQYDAPYWTASSTSGALPVNNRASLPTMLRGWIDRIGGRDGTCLFIHELERGPPDDYMLVHRSQFMYCQGPRRVTYENIFGDEGVGQLQRVPAITLEAIV